MNRMISILVMLVSVVSCGYGERLVKTFEYHSELDDFSIMDVDNGRIGIIIKDGSMGLKGFITSCVPACIPTRYTQIAIPGNMRLDTIYYEGERILAIEQVQLAGGYYDTYTHLLENKEKEPEEYIVDKATLVKEFGNPFKYLATENWGIVSLVKILVSPFQYEGNDGNLYFYRKYKLILEFEEDPDALEKNTNYEFYGVPLDYVENPKDAIEIMTAHGIEKFW